MAYQNHPAHQMELQHFADQQMSESGGGSAVRGIYSPRNEKISEVGGSGGGGGAPTWLNSAVVQQHNNRYTESNFLHLQTNSGSSNSPTADTAAGSRFAPQTDESEKRGVIRVNDRYGKDHYGPAVNWESARCKAEVLSHPLYEQLLEAHVSCLRIATPVDQLPRIDAQLAQSQSVVAKYLAVGVGSFNDKELDQFMTNCVLLLCSFKEQLQQHVRVHAMEAVMACWELEQSLQTLTGASPGEGTGETMSDDEDNHMESDTHLFDESLDSPDSMGFGPLILTDSERSLMERVRLELKHELKNGYKDKIVDIREEILRKRRAGKLPGDTTSHLKAWWKSHSKWPYPTEEDKARLVQETGLQLKQINNWFINQRKRNWHSNSTSSNSSKTKRKREVMQVKPASEMESTNTTNNITQQLLVIMDCSVGEL